MENKEEKVVNKTKSNKFLLVVIVVVFMCLSFAVGFFAHDFVNKKSVANTNVVTDIENDEENLDASAVIEKINHFIEAGSSSSITGYGYSLAKKLHEGTSELTYDEKLEMTYIGIKYKRLMHQTGETPEKYKDDSTFTTANYYKFVESGMGVQEILISDFEDEYMYLFDEEIGNYEAKDISGCPHPFIKDEELGKIFLTYSCGGSGFPELESEIIKQEEDSDFYYIYQKSGFDGNMSEVVWKFDKKGKFISTTNNG